MDLIEQKSDQATSSKYDQPAVQSIGLTRDQQSALKIYFSEVLGINHFVVPADWSEPSTLELSPFSLNQMASSDGSHNEHFSADDSRSSLLSSGNIESTIAVFCDEPSDELHMLLDKILKAMGLNFDKVLCVYSHRKTLEVAQRGIYKATLVLGNRVGFEELTEGQTELDPRAGLILKTFSLEQLNHHLELKRLAWASLQLWIKRVKLA